MKPIRHHNKIVAVLIVIFLLIFVIPSAMIYSSYLKHSADATLPGADAPSNPSASTQADNATAASPNSCLGNKSDSCAYDDVVALFPAGTVETNAKLRSTNLPEYGRRIAGVVTAIHDPNVQIRTSSGRMFTIIFPLDIQSWWNTTIGPTYSNYKFDVGDTILIKYVEHYTDHTTTIPADQVTESFLVVAHGTNTEPGLPLQRYPNK